MSYSTEKFKELIEVNKNLTDELNTASNTIDELNDQLQKLKRKEREYYQSHRIMLYERRKRKEENIVVNTHQQATTTFKKNNK